MSSACLCLMSRDRPGESSPERRTASMCLPISVSSRRLLQLRHGHRWYFDNSACLRLARNLHQALGDCLNGYGVSNKANPWNTAMIVRCPRYRLGYVNGGSAHDDWSLTELDLETSAGLTVWSCAFAAYVPRLLLAALR